MLRELFTEMGADLSALRERDPASRSVLEAVLTYPGLHAVWGYRLAHVLWARSHYLSARILSALVRLVTGVDIHPGAAIGPGLFIDHANGVVIGETAQVGAGVTMFQGVTLGGVGRGRDRRHPQVGDGVILGAGAKVLGAVTLGAGAKVGANAVVLVDVPAGATAVGVPARIIQR
jgi:serine O-acetyltransferase